MDQVLIQLVMDDQGEVSLEYLADLVRLLPPEKIVTLLAHLAAELDKGRPGVAGRPHGRQAAPVGRPTSGHGIMANSEHIRWLQEGVAVWNQRRRRDPFTPDLSSEDISRQLGGHEREDMRQISVDLKDINLSGANLSDATLRDTDLTGAAFYDSSLIRATLIGSHFTGATFVGGSLRGANLQSAQLPDAKFYRVDLTSARLVGANLKGAQFWQCNLQGAHLYNADLVGADLVESRPWTARLFFPSQDNTASVSFARKIG